MTKLAYLQELGDHLYQLSNDVGQEESSIVELALKDAAAAVQDYAGVVNLLKSLSIDLDALKAIMTSDYFETIKAKEEEIDTIVSTYQPKLSAVLS